MTVENVPLSSFMDTLAEDLSNKSRPDLRARIEALEAENATLAAGSCDVPGGKLGDEHGHSYCSLQKRIEALEAENARLREALGWFLYDSRFVVQVGGNPYVVLQMIEAARAVLNPSHTP